MARKPAKKAARKPAKKTAAKRPAAKKTAAKRPAVKKPVRAKAASSSSLFRPVKQSVTIRLDSDVVAWFKKQADKYQTEINGVLRSYATKRGL
jgi:uncharacterized protein (DUF4415 family)